MARMHRWLAAVALAGAVGGGCTFEDGGGFELDFGPHCTEGEQGTACLKYHPPERCLFNCPVQGQLALGAPIGVELTTPEGSTLRSEDPALLEVTAGGEADVFTLEGMALGQVALVVEDAEGTIIDRFIFEVIQGTPEIVRYTGGDPPADPLLLQVGGRVDLLCHTYDQDGRQLQLPVVWEPAPPAGDPSPTQFQAGPIEVAQTFTLMVVEAVEPGCTSIACIVGDATDSLQVCVE